MEDTPASEIDFARHDRIRPIRWTGQSLELLDQRRLPFEVEYLACANSDEVAAAIHALAVRGAPAIGIAAAWGAVLAAQERSEEHTSELQSLMRISYAVFCLKKKNLEYNTYDSTYNYLRQKENHKD